MGIKMRLWLLLLPEGENENARSREKHKEARHLRWTLEDELPGGGRGPSRRGGTNEGSRALKQTGHTNSTRQRLSYASLSRLKQWVLTHT